MRARAVDWSLFALVLFEFISGLGSFLVGRPAGRWVFTLHSVVGLSILLLLWWKFRRVERRVTEPRRWQPATAVSILLALLALATVGTGVFWTIFQRPIDYPNGQILHATAAIALLVVLLWHTVLRFKPLKRRDVTDRRTALGWLALLGTGGLLWGAQSLGNRALATPGADRRFTGSRLHSRDSGNSFPLTIWMFDNPAPVDDESFRLHVRGLVEQPATFTPEDVLAKPGVDLRATLDCTGGWYTEQTWRGVSVGQLLDDVGIVDDARIVSFQSITGYRWSLPLAEARDALLATHVLDGDGVAQPLTHGHGAPLRLVAPGRRGFQWVKWVTAIEVQREIDVGQWGAIFVSGLREREG